MIRKEFPSVLLIANRTNLGYVRANNQGSSVAIGRYILLLNSDTVLLEGGVEDIVGYLDSHSDVGIATGIVLNPDRTFHRPFRRFPHWLGAIYRHSINPIKRVDHFLEKRFRLSDLNEYRIHEVDWVSGAYLFVRQELLYKGMVFDEDLQMYYEDTLLCLRVRAMGYRIIYLPFAPLIHHHGASAKKVQQDAIFQSYKSSVKYFEKVYGDRTALVYSLAVKVIWCIVSVSLTLIQFLPIPKVSKKASLFRKLVKRAWAC
jgi:GT2 family glycosyltransferase